MSTSSEQVTSPDLTHAHPPQEGEAEHTSPEKDDTSDRVVSTTHDTQAQADTTHQPVGTRKSERTQKGGRL